MLKPQALCTSEVRKIPYTLRKDGFVWKDVAIMWPRSLAIPHLRLAYYRSECCVLLEVEFRRSVAPLYVIVRPILQQI